MLKVMDKERTQISIGGEQVPDGLIEQSIDYSNRAVT